MLTPSDLFALEIVSDARISPDGQRVAYVVTTCHAKDDGYRAAIHVAPTSGGAARRFTAGLKRDQHPRWSPDGSRLAFVSNRSGKNQIYCMPTHGGEPVVVTNQPEGVEGPPVWSPDGQRLAFVAKVAPADPDEWAGKSDAERQRLRAARPKEIRALRYKLDGEGFKDDKVKHVFTVAIGAGAAPDRGPTVTRITEGDADSVSPVWAPDGRSIAFVSNRTAERELNDVSDIWLVDAAGGEPRRLTPSCGPVATPAFSPDGRSIAYVGHDTQPEFGPTTNDTVWLVAVAGGAPRQLSGALDQTVGSGLIGDTQGGGPYDLIWTADGRSVYFGANDGGNVSLFRVDVGSGVVQKVVGGDRQLLCATLSAPRADGGASLVFAATNPLDPGQVYIANADGSNERAITALNQAWLAAANLVKPERFTYAAPDGGEIEAWLMRPTGAVAQPPPGILYIHGGPHGAYGNCFFFEFQLLAARGYAVVYPNPRGSTGYGQAFTAALRRDWGGIDYRDVMACVDHAVAQGWVDGGRLGVAGGSYGGYLTNWIIGQNTRFKAAVSGRSTSNRYAHYGSSDMGWRTGDWEFGGPPWQNADHYLERSPITYVDRVETPLLLMSQEQDHRCPIEQAEQFFTALRRLGKTVEFVRYPNESHGMSRAGKPSNRLYRLSRILDWFDAKIQA